MKAILSALFVVVSFYSCKKDSNKNNCTAPSVINIPGPNTVTQGWDFYLSLYYADPLYKYIASGPNGWNMELNGRQVVRRNLQLQDAGTYFVRAYDNNNCVVQQGSTSLIVSAIQNAPCEATLQNNTCKTDLTGLSDFSFSSTVFNPDIVTSQSTFTCYTVAPIPANTYLYFMFKGTSYPIPGKYKTIFSYNAAGIENEVAVHFNDGATNKLHLSREGQDIYVTTVNGKRQICFCNLAVSNSISGVPNYISGKVIIN